MDLIRHPLPGWFKAEFLAELSCNTLSNWPNCKSRTVEQKRRLAELITRYAVEKAGVSQDDVTLIIHAIHLKSMRFGGEKPVSDINLSMR
ncbi:tautomerase family protein [Dickeya zeae]|uniref:tautomerase family protein n=1 Tax=Dickeya zeae TaxID=204042 RepID=UPI0009B78C44|nr:tautomerase family protein [Dickeya zeae]